LDKVSELETVAENTDAKTPACEDTAFCAAGDHCAADGGQDSLSGHGCGGTAPGDEECFAENDRRAAPGCRETGDADGQETGNGQSSGSSADDAPRDLLAAERDKYLRLAAEYDNFRKRSAKELQAVYGGARADTIIRLLPVYDNLERALKMTCTDEAFYKGVEMTLTGLMEVFENMGVEPIQALGEPFDPNRHNAVMAIENPALGEKIISEEFQKGFMLGDRVLRFSSVVVAN